MFRERVCFFAATFLFIEDAGIGARDRSKCFTDERTQKNAKTLEAFTVC